MFDFLKKYIRPVKRSSSDIETAGGAVIPADAGIQTESGMDPSVKPEDDRPSADFEKVGFIGVPNGDNTTELSSSLVEDQIDSGLGQNDGGIRDDSNVGTGTGTDSKSGSNSALGRTGTIQVMISRRNKSLTVEAVEAKVTERVAAMKIEDEVNLLVANAVAMLKPANTLTLDVNGNVILTGDPTKTVNILANNAEIRNITDSLITLQSDYEGLKNSSENRLSEIESTILTSVFEKEYYAENGLEVGEIVSYDGSKAVRTSGENRDNILGVVTRPGVERPDADIDSALQKGDQGQESSTSENIGTGTGTDSKSGSTSALGRIGTGKALVTTRGRVKIQVTKENGEVKKGDAITGSTEKAGLGTKAISEGMIIGYALEDARPDAERPDADIDRPLAGGDSETGDAISVGTVPKAGSNFGTGTVEIAIAPVWYQAGDATSVGTTATLESISALGRVGTGTVLSIAELTVEKDSTIYGNLNVMGSANFTDIFASGKLSIGLLTLNSTDNSINVIADTLNLQNEYGAGDVNIFGGKIVLTSTGSIKVLAEVTAKKYNIDISDVKAASAGKVTVKSGEKEITVETSALTKDSLIFVTAENSANTFTYEVTFDNKIRIYTGAGVDKDTVINWWIVN